MAVFLITETEYVSNKIANNNYYKKEVKTIQIHTLHICF
jgi:hypothetical protein